MTKVKILATGMYAPKKIMTNNDWKEFVDTSDEWIFERTGIRERHISSRDENEFPSDMATYAAADALKTAGLEPNDIDMIIFASVNPDYKLPNTASVVQQKLGITNKCACMDIAAACSGFVYEFNMANSFIKTGLAKKVLVIGSEVLTQEMDWTDRRSCVLFGDGCGVAILGASDENDGSEILATNLGSDGKGGEYFSHPIGGSVNPVTKENIENKEVFMRMKGQEMFKMATRSMAKCAKDAIADAGLSLADVNWIIPHQANIRIIKTVAKLLDAPMEKFITNIHKYGNTSAASIGMALHEGITEGKIKRGDIVLLDAFGAGLTYGATLLKY